MPQPATHYLVTRRAIPKEYWGTWWDKYKPYFGLGSSAPDLFYFPLVPKIEVRKDIAWANLANPLHSSSSYDMFCTLISKAKQNKQAGNADPEKQFAFTFGYYCHVVTDCIFHPYVYRSTGDHWNTDKPLHESEHKIQELSIDTGIYHKFYDKSQNFSRIQWDCKDKNQPLLDFSIAQLLHDGLQEVYPDCYPASSNVYDQNHPIQQAYSALSQAIPKLFEGVEINLWGLHITQNIRDILPRLQDNFFTSPYPDCPSLNSYTPEELFNFSSGACRKIFVIALSFWNSDAINAKDYFKSYRANYLNSGNWNLDTGLPCQYNNFEPMRNESPEHYSFKSDDLRQIYATLQAEYNPSDFA